MCLLINISLAYQVFESFKFNCVLFEVLLNPMCGFISDSSTPLAGSHSGRGVRAHVAAARPELRAGAAAWALRLRAREARGRLHSAAGSARRRRRPPKVRRRRRHSDRQRPTSDLARAYLKTKPEDDGMD